MAKKTENTPTNDSNIQNISLSEAILAPLLSIFKAQIHASRAFLNFLLQIATPHIELNEEGQIKEEAKNKEGKVYTQNFRFEKDINGTKHIVDIKIPTISLVPLIPLGIEEGEFEFNFQIQTYHRHRQIQQSEHVSLQNDQYDRYYRPWYLIDRPINFTGIVNPTSSEAQLNKESLMKIRIRLTKQPIPAGLDKLITTFHQMTDINTSEISNSK